MIYPDLPGFTQIYPDLPVETSLRNVFLKSVNVPPILPYRRISLRSSSANEMTIDSLWMPMPIKSILDCVMSISEPVNEGLHFHIMALAASAANPRRTEIGTLFRQGESLCLGQFKIYRNARQLHIYINVVFIILINNAVFLAYTARPQTREVMF